MALTTTTTSLYKSNPKVVSMFKVYSRICGIAAFIIGSIVLYGWIFDIPLLKSLHPAFVSMKVNTAIAIMLAGVSLSLFRSSQESSTNAFLSSFCAALVAAIGLITLMEYIGDWNYSIDQLLINEPIGTVGTYIPGRMALNTAFCFSCLGIGLLLARSKPAALFAISQLINLAGALVAITASIGYFYNINEFYGYTNFTKMALHTAIVLLGLSTGILCAVPDRGLMKVISGNDSGGYLARRLLPATIGIPILIGWLRLEGERHEFFGTAFGVLLVAVIYIVLFICLVWAVAQRLDRFDFKRKVAEEAVHQSEEKFRAIFENNSAAMAIIEPDTTISMVNDAYCQVSGYTKEEVVGMSWTKQIPPDDIERLREYNRRRLANPQDAPDKYEFKFYRKNGVLRNALMSISMIESSRKIISSFIDVTERKQAEEELRALSRAVEQSPASIVITDTKGVIEYVNPKFIQLTGYSLEEAVGKNPRILKSGEKPTEEYKQLWDMITTGKEWRGEFHNKKKNGELYWESASISPIKDPQGGATHFLAVKEDITQRKQAEEEREKLIKELQFALDNVKTLQGLIPICANCKKIRDDTGYWQQVEGYIQKHSDAKFTHGICPECAVTLYPNYSPKNKG